MSIINKIIDLLDKQKKTQKELTDYLGLDKSTFSQWKNGKSQSYNKYISQISVFLGVTPTELLDDEFKTFSDGDKIRMLREEKGISQEELSEKTGYPLASITKYENGERKLTDTVRLKIIEALGLSDDEISLFPHKRGLFDFRDDIDVEIDEALHALNTEGKKKALEYLKDLAMLPKYTENADAEEGVG